MNVKVAIAGMGMVATLVLSGCRLVRLVSLYKSTKQQVTRTASIGTIDIPFFYQRDWIMLHLCVKQGTDSLEGDFVFDSGAYTSLFDSCQPIHVWIPENLAELPVQGALGKSSRVLKVAKDISMQAGQFAVLKPRLMVTKKPDFFPPESRGIIGADFFRDFILTIDFRQKIFRLQAADHFEAAGRAPLHMKMVGNSNPVLKNVKLGDLPAMDYLIDAGNSGPLLIQKPDEQRLSATMGSGIREYAFKQNKVRDASGKIIASSYYIKTAATIEGLQCPEYEISGLVNVTGGSKYGNMGLAFLKQVFESISFDFSKKQFYYRISTQPVSMERMDRDVYFGQEGSSFFTGPVLIQSAWYKQGLQPGMEVIRINEGSPAIYIEERKAGRAPELRSVTIHTAEGKLNTITK